MLSNSVLAAAFLFPMWSVDGISAFRHSSSPGCAATDTVSAQDRRAFAVADPAAWNSLSDELRDPVF